MTAPLRHMALDALAPDRAVSLDRSRCARHRCGANACSACIDACPEEALSWGEGGLALESGACTGCLACFAVCPTAALEAPGPSLLQVLAALAEHELPVLGCSGRPGSEAHARLPCLGALAHSEAMVLCALVFKDGLHIDMTACNTCPNGHIAAKVEAAFDLMRELVPSPAIKLIRDPEALGFQPPALSRRQLFSMFRQRAGRAAADMVVRLRGDDAPQSYGAKMLPATRALLIRALRDCSHELRRTIAGRLFGDITFTDRCTGLERCVGVCPTGAIQPGEADDGPPVFHRSLCVSCRSCLAFCPDQGLCLSAPAAA